MPKDYPEEYKMYISEIFLTGAHKLFGELLSLLCEKACISQTKLGKKARVYREYLVSNKYILSESDTKAVDQSGISRIIKGKRPLSYAQAYIWLTVLRDVFDSDEYKGLCEKKGRAIFEFTEDFETDMWRLALGGTPKEVVEAYERRKDMIKKQSMQ